MIYLASQSPRRRTLLAQLGVGFETLDVAIDETPQAGETPDALARRLAAGKVLAGRACLDDADAHLVLGADTVVVLDGEPLGKPRDGDDAARLLMRLSGRCHQVLSAVALASADGTRVRLSRSRVCFRELARPECEAYAASGEPLDKAGAYLRHPGPRRRLRARASRQLLGRRRAAALRDGGASARSGGLAVGREGQEGMPMKRIDTELKKVGNWLVDGFHLLGLFVIGGTVVWAAVHEYLQMIQQGRAALDGILLLFIYLELGAMVGIYFKTNHLPVRFLLYIAITALTRLLAVDAKTMPDQHILVITGAIVLLVLAVIAITVVRYKYPGEETR